MQYHCHPVKGNNANREKEMAKKEYALTFFPLVLFIIYRGQYKIFILCSNKLACHWRDLYLFLCCALVPAKLNLLCCINTSLTIP
ncbi:MAG TPA: hypothetical protein PLE33_00750 [Candidatus Cloacimonas sp.]|nr:hypothetical protein [Candidatus Cloacimonas sp.]HPS59776.1 hypothetical protein [Candidatus Cloacimonas sp.]